ncbi:MAG: phosphoribosylformylglycinamidine cyclo-ligase, partial [Chitinophagaceae bacterium]|nr:phosphoribosylformylglycinamidine cyclo-ligase [Chitinophagaceae bacterium]
RTIAVNGTMAARWKKDRLVTNERIAPGNVIVGLAGYGKADHESEYNSGIGSNGHTSARHDVLSKYYAENFPETFDGALPDNVVYIGNHKLADGITVKFQNSSTTIGKLLLSPTRTFAPVVKQILEEHFDAVHGMVHCSGGGQTKCLKYVPEKVQVTKDNLFEPPEIFQIIQQSSRADDKEMYQVFNMGCRFEIYIDEKNADKIISIANAFNVDAQVIGRVEEGEKKRLIIMTDGTEISY